LREEWKESIFVPTHKKGDKTVVIIEASQFVSYIKYFNQHPAVQVNSYAEEIIADHHCGY
jgi:hypothetical protein